jgi:hypothetical protein
MCASQLTGSPLVLERRYSLVINDLAFYFTYLDLICTDCGVFNERVSNYLIEAAKKEYSLKGRAH